LGVVTQDQATIDGRPSQQQRSTPNSTAHQAESIELNNLVSDGSIRGPTPHQDQAANEIPSINIAQALTVVTTPFKEWGSSSIPCVIRTWCEPSKAGQDGSSLS